MERKEKLSDKEKIEMLREALKKVQEAWDTGVDAKSRWGHVVRYALSKTS